MSLRLTAGNLLRACTGLLTLAAVGLTGVRAAAAPAGASATEGTAYVTGFKLPGFGDDGYKAWEIQGTEAQAAAEDATTIQITDLKLIRYAGGQALSIESTLVCAHATVHTDKATNETTVSSPEKLFISGGANNNYSAQGNNWTWDGVAAQMTAVPSLTPAASKPVIHIDKNVFVLFTTAAAAPTGQPAANSPAPQQVQIFSDTLDIYQQETDNRFVFTGNIRVLDGETITTCQWLEVLAQRSAAPNPAVTATPRPATAPVNLGVGHVERIVAKDQVEVVQKDPNKGEFKASGGQAEFNPAEQDVIMTESPQLRAEASDTLLQGGRIIWKQDRQVMQVEPPAGTPNAPGRVSVSLPPLASLQKDAPATPTGGPRMVITGESLTAQFEQGQQNFAVEKSVHVEDEELRVNADHLDADFVTKANPDAAGPAAGPTLGAALGAVPPTTLPPMGKLSHLTVSGNATIFQGTKGTTNLLTTTTPRAEILPADREIDFNAGAHIVDGRSHAIIDGGRVSLLNNGQNGTIESTPGRPATIILPSLRTTAMIGGADTGPVNTTVVSESVTMQRGEERSMFTFDSNVHVTALDYDSTCGQLIVTTNNLPAGPGDDPLTAPAKFGQITELQEINHVVVRQGAYQALSASAEIFPQAKLAPDMAEGATEVAPSAAPAQAYRLVQLHGDPKGITGPFRPEVDVPLKQTVDLVAAEPGAGRPDGKAVNADAVARITSDEQWLMTNPVADSPDNPAGNTYYFLGNVRIDAEAFNATSDRMRAEGAPAKDGDKIAVERIIIEDHVTFKQSSTEITASRAEILPGSHLVTLTGNVVVKDLVKGGSSTSEHVVYNMETRAVDTDTPPAKAGEPVKRPSFTIPGGSVTRH